jgi:hypothetical protein
MRKILFSILLLFFCSQIFAQNLSKERITTAPDNKSSNARFKSASVLKVNVFAPLLGYSQFSLEKSIDYLRNIEFGLGIIGAGRDLYIQPRFLGLGLDRFGRNNYRPGHNVKGEDDLYGHPFVLAVAKDNPSVNFAFSAGFRFGFLLE